MKYILNQTISSTHVDAHGEKNTKEFLEFLAGESEKRLPLHQHHNMELETLGYLENFKVVPDEDSTGEWLLKADVYFSCESIDDALKGFSFSVTEPITDNFDRAKYHLYLPWPHYNNQELIKELKSQDEELAIGKWRKKAIDAGTLGLIVSAAGLVLGPAWTNAYNNYVAPNLKKLFGKTTELKKKNLTVDFIQPVQDCSGNNIQVQFIPNRGEEEKCFQTQLIYNGLKKVEIFLASDTDAKEKGVTRVKLCYDIFLKDYKLIHVQYNNGTDKKIA